ncbi:MAG: hypothetical protein HFI36_03740 [Bacilli bacterium]|jgi:hypothetical protein|nr:hypothetical protein [Bacilli bacterium]
MELVILMAIAIFVIIYRRNDGSESFYTFMKSQFGIVYQKYAPYSFQTISAKMKELKQEYTMKDYMIQIVVLGGLAGGIAYLYFYSLIMVAAYGGVAIALIPYLAWLRSKRLYSEYIFEQIQVYTTNVIMEFNTTQSFVKSLEGVRDSGIVEDPVLEDIKMMINMSYQNGTIDESIEYFNQKYPYYMVKNMHQLFLQITKEGAKDSGEALENMSMDIDSLVEGVYRDQMDRKQFHTKFITFALVLFLLVLVMQVLLGKDSYLKLLDMWYVHIILHAIIFINCFFLLSGEKYYNDDVGVE